MISTKPFLNQIEERPALNIAFVVKYLRKSTNNTALVQDDGYYASYDVPMPELGSVNILMDFSKLHFGGTRYWLVCRHCHKRVANLYPASGTLACRHCLGLEYGSRLYKHNAICYDFIRHKKAAMIMSSRRMTYSGKPTRSARRLNRLVTVEEQVGLIISALNS